MRVDAFAAFELSRCPSPVRRWRSDAEILRGVEDEISDLVRVRMKDITWAEGYAQASPVTGATPQDYQLRCVDFDSDGTMLAGIHFLGKEARTPFVGVLARNKPLRDAKQVRRVVHRLMREFALFSPRWVRFYQSVDSEEYDFRTHEGVLPDQRLVVGKIAELKLVPRPPHMDRIELRKKQSMESMESWYTRYLEEYANVHKKYPELKDRVLPSSHEALDACGKEAALFEIMIDGDWGGIIAGYTDRIGTLAGYVVVEELLFASFRGRGFATSAQRHFIECLPAIQTDLLFGTIDARNLPSLRTALRIGRTDIGGWFFLSA